MSDQANIFQIIATNTIATMTRFPDKRDEWRANLIELQEQAKTLNDQEMETLLKVIIELVDGIDLAQLKPILTGIFSECWNFIVETIRLQQDPIVLAVNEYLNARTWLGCKEVVESKKEYLLTDEAEKIVDSVIEQYKDTPSVSRLEKLRSILIKCRSEGIEEAFSDLLNPTTMPYIPPHLLHQLISAQSGEEREELVRQHPSLVEVLDWLNKQQIEEGQSDRAMSIEERLSEPVLKNPEEGVKRFVTFLNSRNLSQLRKYCLAVLSELSCSPWKFDVLWELWDELEFKIKQSADLAHELLDTDDPELRLFVFTAFDDLTIFADIVGESGDKRMYSRESFRAAYLLIRRMVFRHVFGAPPLPPHAMTAEAYQERIAMVGSMFNESVRKEVHEVLAQAADRYKQRGKNDGVIFCKQTSDMLRTIEEAGFFKKGPLLFVDEMFKLMMSADKPVLMLEIALNWWPFVKYIREEGILHGTGQEAAEVVKQFTQSIRRLSPFAWLMEERPGIASTMVFLVMLRLNSQLEPPYSLWFFPINWIGKCQENIVWLKEKWSGDPAIPQEFLHSLLDMFVLIGHRTRTYAGEEGKADEFFFEVAQIYADVMTVASRRARQEMSIEEYAQALEHLKDRVKKVPFAVEGLITMGTMPTQLGNEGALTHAILEAAAVLVGFTENANLKQMIYTALGQQNWTSEQQIQFALLQERQGRPDLAIVALYNAGANLTKGGEYDKSVEVYSLALDLVKGVMDGLLYVPSTTTFHAVTIYLSIVQELGMAYFLLEKYQSALETIDDALNRIVTLDSEEARQEEGYSRKIVMLHLFKAECFERLEGNMVAERYIVSVLNDVSEEDKDYLSTMLKAKLAFYAQQKQEIDKAIELYSEAQHHSYKYRRTLPYESDKIDFNLNPAVQASSIWLAEHLLGKQRPLEAITAFEAGRSRALLDLLGVSSAVQLPRSLIDEKREQGQALLDRARSIVYPGAGKDVFGMRTHWRRALSDLEEWLVTIEREEPDYVRIVRGQTLSSNEIRKWATSVNIPTAVVYWFLGNEYSYQVVVRAVPGQEFQDPIVRKVTVTIPWLQSQSEVLQKTIKSRKNLPAGLLDSLSGELIAPIEDLLQSIDAVYLCQSHQLYDLPLTALLLRNQPISVTKQVSVIPSLSVLNVLQYIDRCQKLSKRSIVFGPEFPLQARWVAKLLETDVATTLYDDNAEQATQLFKDCQILHLICHGYFDTRDTFASGFQFTDQDENTKVLTGRQIMRWGLGARLVVLEACDTRRQWVSVSDDSFGLGRFFQIAGTPSLLLADWEVRNDITMRFMRTFYKNLKRFGKDSTGIAGRGEAYRSAVTETRDWVGPENVFLWAPFTLIGALD